MPQAEKVAKVAELKGRIEGSRALILADHRGLTVVDARELRTGLRDADTSFAIVKNTLMKLAAGEAGLAELHDLLTGPTAVAFVNGDPVLAAKRLAEAQRKFPALEIKGGYVEGRVLSAADARALAKLESREVMLSMVAGLAKSEVSRAASMFQALQGRFLGVLDAFKGRVQGAEAEAPSEPPAVTEAAATGESDEATEATDTSDTSDTSETNETTETTETTTTTDEA